ncbi:hypothetical protein QBC38DRAFT_449124 [Podospora fimiseda]|uniref:Heterokaryon incompatibility domain-containing protein n=1 Tax=Podospora fimiseda TaxID=252190 RepID=A0AAN7BF23_9PEZI|nr:hypothetical protein QBC38DRAFT_449124 [Podospora fimiseda]
MPIPLASTFLSSGWMRRLWTLQEAYVTRQLALAFEEGETGSLERLWSPLDEREEVSKPEAFDLFMTAMIRKKIFQNLINDVRRLHKGTPQPAVRAEPLGVVGEEGNIEEVQTVNRDGAANLHWRLLIANAWSSARYRDVGKVETETFALASMLNITLDGDHEDPPDYRDMRQDDKRRRKGRQELMKDFLSKIERHAIAPGMIFLPGERLSLKGFGWAPMKFPSEIALLVHVYTPSDQAVIEQAETRTGHKVVDRKHWKSSEKPNFESLDENTLQMTLDSITSTTMLCCKIIWRLGISHVSLHHNPSEENGHMRSVLAKYGAFDGQIIAETVNDQQYWCVDGYEDDDELLRVVDDRSVAGSSRQSTLQSAPRSRVHTGSPTIPRDDNRENNLSQRTAPGNLTLPQTPVGSQTAPRPDRDIQGSRPLNNQDRNPSNRDTEESGDPMTQPQVQGALQESACCMLLTHKIRSADRKAAVS